MPDPRLCADCGEPRDKKDLQGYADGSYHCIDADDCIAALRAQLVDARGERDATLRQMSVGARCIERLSADETALRARLADVERERDHFMGEQLRAEHDLLDAKAALAAAREREARLLTTLADVLEQATGEDSQAISAFRDGFLLLAEHGLFHVRTHVHRRVTGEYDREKLRALADGGGEGEGR